MKKIITGLYCLGLWTGSMAQTSKPSIAIIPEPVKITTGTGSFSLPQNILIEAGPQPELKQTIAFLKDRLSIPTGLPVTIKNTAPTATIKLVLNPKAVCRVRRLIMFAPANKLWTKAITNSGLHILI